MARISDDSVQWTNPSIAMSRVVVLALWPGALQSQIDYYIDNYRLLYPEASVYLLRPSLSHGSEDEIYHLAESISRLDRKVAILVHIFGTVAGARTANFLRVYHSMTGVSLPAQSVIHDVVPSFAVNRPSRQFRQYLTLFAVLILITWSTVGVRFMSLLTLCQGGSMFFQNGSDEDLHNPALLPSSATRSYVFADKGDIIFWKPEESNKGLVEPQGQILEQREWSCATYKVQRRHVGPRRRFSVDQETFWTAVDDSWT